MTPVNVNNFLLSLVKAIELRSAEISASSPLVFDTADPTVPRSLWLDEIQAGKSTDPASVIRCYGGGAPGGINFRRPTVSLQALTRGSSSPAVLAQAWLLQEAMLDDGGHARTHWRITGRRLNAGAMVEDPDQDWMVLSLKSIQTPGIIGRDDDGKWMASVNYDCEFNSVAKAT